MGSRAKGKNRRSGLEVSARPESAQGSSVVDASPSRGVSKSAGCGRTVGPNRWPWAATPRKGSTRVFRKPSGWVVRSRIHEGAHSLIGVQAEGRSSRCGSPLASCSAKPFGLSPKKHSVLGYPTGARRRETVDQPALTPPRLSPMIPSAQNSWRSHVKACEVKWRMG